MRCYGRTLALRHPTNSLPYQAEFSPEYQPGETPKLLLESLVNVFRSKHTTALAHQNAGNSRLFIQSIHYLLEYISLQSCSVCSGPCLVHSLPA